MCFRDAEGHTPGESARAIAESQLPGAPPNSQSRPEAAARFEFIKPTIASRERCRVHRNCLWSSCNSSGMCCRRAAILAMGHVNGRHAE